MLKCLVPVECLEQGLSLDLDLNSFQSFGRFESSVLAWALMGCYTGQRIPCVREGHRESSGK